MIDSGTPTATGPRLLGDIGGTHARLGWQAAAGAAIQAVQQTRCDEHASLGACLQRYLQQLSATGRARPTQAALGLATPVLGDAIRMTNRGWSLSIDALRAELGLQRLLVLNDFTALALALPGLGDAELWPCGGQRSAQPAPLALLGPGTGLGVSGLIPGTGAGAAWTALQTEGGHVGLAAQTEREAALLARLRERHGRASAERVLSGPGLVSVMEALCVLDGVPVPAALTPVRVLEMAQAATQPQATETLDVFCALLGDVAGDLVLTLGARGGVYIGGGLVPRLGRERFMRSAFRSRFEAKGRLSAYLRDVAAYVIASPEPPALLGASRAL
jgi:glucokinase